MANVKTNKNVTDGLKNIMGTDVYHNILMLAWLTFIDTNK